MLWEKKQKVSRIIWYKGDHLNILVYWWKIYFYVHIFHALRHAHASCDTKPKSWQNKFPKCILVLIQLTAIIGRGGPDIRMSDMCLNINLINKIYCYVSKLFSIRRVKSNIILNFFIVLEKYSLKFFYENRK